MINELERYPGRPEALYFIRKEIEDICGVLFSKNQRPLEKGNLDNLIIAIHN
jgi:hypothetical protein